MSHAERMLLRAKEAAERLSISQRKLWELTARGEIAVIRFDRNVRYAIEDLDTWIATKRKEARS